MDFALASVNDPLGYLLISQDGPQPHVIVPFYVSHILPCPDSETPSSRLTRKVPKVFSGNITVSYLLSFA